ncbi:hypothetical protein [Zhouia amylolytica]|uniref:Tetratricopeptide repeat protein n=1 Tax=Zhouia amylolytica AD3 TaxID=1286632 RepID=W2UK90_9FLAO|nr:hypothetical protein [Zhouia amylolytica]ETN93742.1 hypothetical protein P278_31520 [Zhouia amylolytica AD3]
MKKFLLVFIAGTACFSAAAQSNTELKTHYEAYYKQMKTQGDMRGAINALTHLNVLNPSQERTDTLAYYYANSGQNLQAVKLLGTEKDPQASDLAVEVKAAALKALNQPQLAVQQYDILFGRKPDVYLAYDLLDLNLQIGKTAEAKTYLDYGIANAKDDEMLPFYQSNPPYQVPIKAAFIYQKGLYEYNQDKSQLDTAIATIDEALAIAPNFKLAQQIREILVKQKEAPATPEASDKQ